MKNSIITLLTDFGNRDFFVGAMKGVILSINPNAGIIDISHEIPPQDVKEAAFILRGSYPYFPPDTIHLSVIDPGVGGSRRPIAVDAGTCLFVGPDNGIFTWVYREHKCSIYEIRESKYFRPEISRTFHGRDVFAPVCAFLSRGDTEVSGLGPEVTDPVSLQFPEPVVGPDDISGEVLHVDRYGNLISNIPENLLATGALSEKISIKIGRTSLDGVSQTYSQKKPGEPLAVFGGAGFLEVSVNRGSAARILGVGTGEKVKLSFQE